MLACDAGHTDIVHALLADARVQVNLQDNMVSCFAPCLLIKCLSAIVYSVVPCIIRHVPVDADRDCVL